MPAVQPPATVLVTGVTGFSGVWIARALLENGYAVRGTFRSEQKAAHVAALFKAHGDRFTTVVVPDIARVGISDSPRAFVAYAHRSRAGGCIRWRP